MSSDLINSSLMIFCIVFMLICYRFVCFIWLYLYRQKNQALLAASLDSVMNRPIALGLIWNKLVNVEKNVGERKLWKMMTHPFVFWVDPDFSTLIFSRLNSEENQVESQIARFCNLLGEKFYYHLHFWPLFGKDSSHNNENYRATVTFKKSFRIQLVLNIFKSQHGFHFENFTSEYLSHKFKSPLLWNMLGREEGEHWTWRILHFGNIYYAQYLLCSARISKVPGITKES